jgi:predicted ArsR family transcriptional regulator
MTTSRRRPDVVDALVPERLDRASVLARPAARRVAQVLEDAPDGMTAHQIAAALGVHHSGVRAQLAALEQAGAVQVRTDAPAGRGRPSRRYQLAPDPAEQEAQGHRELVRLLMGLVRQAGFGPDEVERFGEQQGAAIARGDAGPQEIRDAFERLGFAPRELPDDEIPDLVLGHCPFADGVEAPSGDLICILHRGLARGIAERAAPEVELDGLDIVDPHRAGCRLRLSARRSRGDAAA